MNTNKTEVIEFMNKIDRNRERLNISITDLCDTIGVQRSSYYNWMEGVEPGLTSAMRLIEIVGFNGTVSSGAYRDDINPKRHKSLMNRPEAVEYMAELHKGGMSVEDISVAFQTTPKDIQRRLTKHLTINTDEYRKQIK